MFPGMTDSAQHLRSAVKAFIERHELSPTRVGRLLFGNPSFVRVLLGGRMPRLDTADRLLDFIGLEPIGPPFRREVEAYLAVTRAKATAVSEAAVKNRAFIRRLRNGSSPHLKTVDRMRAWIRRNASTEEWRMIEAAVREERRNDRAEAGYAVPPASDENRREAKEAKPLYWSTRELAPMLRRSQRTAVFRVNALAGSERHGASSSIGRARYRAELVTDDAARLRERLETTTGERIAALEAIAPEGPERELPMPQTKASRGRRPSAGMRLHRHPYRQWHFLNDQTAFP